MFSPWRTAYIPTATVSAVTMENTNDNCTAN